MAKTQKELAFLRDLIIQEEWTQRFTELVDRHMDLSDSDNMLYINAGTGGHALAIYEKFGRTTNVFATIENEDMLAIARDKAAAIRADVDFSMLRFDDDAFDAVLADASFVAPADLESFIEGTVRVARTGGDIAIFMPSAGSFGEVFSLLWEAFLNEDLPDRGVAIENLIKNLPTVSRIEEIAAAAGIVNINSQLTNEIFEYENGREFSEAPLVADFLLPAWLECLDENEKTRVIDQLTRLMDAEEIAFRFALKATLLTGEKG